MVTPSNHVIARAPGTLVIFAPYFSAKYRLRPKKFLPSERGARCTVPYGKFGPVTALRL